MFSKASAGKFLLIVCTDTAFYPHFYIYGIHSEEYATWWMWIQIDSPIDKNYVCRDMAGKHAPCRRKVDQ